MGSLDEAIRLSNAKLDSLQNAISNINYDNICIYACGSLGRGEITKKSDLDLFFILLNQDEEKESDISNIDKYNFFSQMYRINKELGFEDPSQGGIYWHFITEKQLLDIGSRVEDYNNSFTARMLLVLEGKALNNSARFDELKNKVIDKYFEEYPEHSSPFYPLFLMNDILRYWYTLTLNYEYRKDSHDDTNKRYWKRLKLKYARFFTCFSMLMCLFKKDLTKEDVKKFSDMRPYERIKYLDENIKELHEGDFFNRIMKEYEWFLDLRNQDSSWWEEGDNKTIALKKADDFHEVLKEMWSIVAANNYELARRMDLIIIKKVEQ